MEIGVSCPKISSQNLKFQLGTAKPQNVNVFTKFLWIFLKKITTDDRLTVTNVFKQA